MTSTSLVAQAHWTGAQEEVRPGGLEELLGRMGSAGLGARVSVGDLRAAVGERSFGAMLGVTGMLAASPLGIIPGLPTTLAATMALISAQMLAGRDSIWLPGVLTRRTMDRRMLRKALSQMRPVARRIDRIMRPRLGALTQGPATRLMALICLVLCVLIPPLELLPFMATLPSAAIAAFGLSIFLADGLLALAALAFSSGAIWVIAAALL